MNINSHNLQIIPEMTYYDSQGNKIKTISFLSEELTTNDSNIELTLYEKDGFIKEHFQIPFRSWTHNYLYNLYCNIIRINQTYLDTNGVSRLIYLPNQFRCDGVINNSTFGIQVGTSGSAATQSIDTYRLSGLINHGTENGTLSYSAHINSPMTYVNNTYVMSMTRTFTNNSEANVNVTEVGIVATTTTQGFTFMIARDIINSNGEPINITVAPRQVLTVKYNLYVPMTNSRLSNFAYWILTDLVFSTFPNSIVPCFYNKPTSIVPANSNYRKAFTAATNNINYGGICVGTGSSPYNQSNSELEWITVGSGSTQQLLFGPCQATDYTKTYSTSGSAAEFIIKRTFTNAGVDPVTIREYGLVASIDPSNNSLLGNNDTTIDKVLITRTLTGDQVIPSGSSIELSYKWMIQV